MFVWPCLTMRTTDKLHTAVSCGQQLAQLLILTLGLYSPRSTEVSAPFFRLSAMNALLPLLENFATSSRHIYESYEFIVIGLCHFSHWNPLVLVKDQFGKHHTKEFGVLFLTHEASGFYQNFKVLSLLQNSVVKKLWWWDRVSKVLCAEWFGQHGSGKVKPTRWASAVVSLRVSVGVSALETAVKKRNIVSESPFLCDL